MKDISLRRLIAIGGLEVISNIYLNTFLIARIYNLATNPTKTIAVYYIIVYSGIAATMFIFGNYFKRKPVKGIRIGMVLNLVLLLVIMRIDDQIINYYLVIACIIGIAMGTYYGPKQILIGYYAANDSVNYCTISTIVSNVVNIIFPITIGAYIERTSFTAVTVCVACVTGLELLLSMRIKAIDNPHKCDLKAFIKFIKEKKMKKLMYTYIITFLGGITSSVLDRTVLILIMLMFGNMLQLGILTTLFAVFTIISSYIVKKFYKSSSKWMIRVSAIMPMLSVLFLILMTNTVTFVAYKAISSVFICILTLLADSNRYNAIGIFAKAYSAEHQTISELALAAGRITGLVLLIFVNEVISGITAIKVMLVLIGAIIITYAVFIEKVQNS